jgi:hypothetical protein
MDDPSAQKVICSSIVVHWLLDPETSESSALSSDMSAVALAKEEAGGIKNTSDLVRLRKARNAAKKFAREHAPGNASLRSNR